MMTSFSAFLALCEGNSPVTGEFTSQRPVTRSFDVLYYLRPNKRLNKQSRRRRFETPSRSLWRHCNALREIPSTFFNNQMHRSHNAPVPCPTMRHSKQKCAHFCSEWCIVGDGTGALWDLWDRSLMSLDTTLRSRQMATILPTIF